MDELKPKMVGAAEFSYVNAYDKLYDRFKTTNNFNLNMWHTAVKEGQLDNYLSLLERNKDKEMRPEFYDDNLYDYEARMLELYEQDADDTEESLEERFKTVYDYTSGKWIEESLGEMTSKTYLKYQLDNLYIDKAKELKTIQEKENKENMSWLEQTGHSILAALGEFGEGVLSGFASAVDVLIAPAYATGSAIRGEGDWADLFVDYISNKGLLAVEQENVRKSLDEYERTHTWIKDINGNLTTAGKYFSGIANSMGMMVPAILSNLVVPGAGMPLFYTGILGKNIYEVDNNPLTKNSPGWLKILNSGTKAAVEAVIEWGLGKVLGGTISNQLLGLTGKAAIQTGARYIVKSALQEGFEEFLQDLSTNIVDQFTEMVYEGYGNTGVTFQTLVDSFLIGAMSSLLMSGMASTKVNISQKIQTINDIKAGASYNKKTRLTYDKDGNPIVRENDIIVERDGKPYKLKGASYLAWADTMSNINGKLKDLREGKSNINEAKKTYGLLTSMAQYYKSFNSERIINAEKLLQRLVKPKQESVNAFGQTYAMDKETSKYNRELAIKNFGEKLTKDFSDMTKGAAIRLQFKDIVNKVTDKLEDGKVTEIISATDKDGIIFKKSVKAKEITSLEEALNRKVDNLSKNYDWVFTTDGHTAVEVDGNLFVSQAWLENYEESEIYKFLAQEQILNAIKTDKDLQTFVYEVIKHNKDFTRKFVSTDKALMDLLFNKSVYEHFLLSNSGSNLIKFKDYIFRLHELIKSLGESKNLSTERKAYLKQIYEQIKETMREPTVKAIINWSINPQLVGADSILTAADKAFILQYQTRKKRFSEAAKGNVTADFIRMIEPIIENANFDESELNLVTRLKDKTLSDKERLIAIGLLELAEIKINDKVTRVNELLDILSDFTIDKKNSLVEKLTEIYGKQTADNITIDMDKSEDAFIKSISLIRDLLKNIVERDNKMKAKNAFVMPVEAFDNFSIPEIQMKANILNEFESTYGVGANFAYVMGEFTNEYLVKVAEDMKAFNLSYLTEDGTVDNEAVRLFITKKLEANLGDNFIVSPVYYDNNIKGITIVTKIDRDLLLKDELKTDDDFLNMFDEEASRNVNEFVKVEIEGLSDYNVIIINGNQSSYLFGNTIYINVSNNRNDYMNSYLDDFVHELNHVIQKIFHLDKGFNPETVDKMPDLLKYISKEYSALISYFKRQFGQKYLDLSYLTYKLITGEIFAEGQLVKGFTIEDGYVVALDGTKFKIPFNNGIIRETKAKFNTKKQIAPDQIYTRNNMSNTFSDILTIVKSKDNSYYKNTYHSKLSKQNAVDLTNEIINPNLSSLVKIKTTINDIITNPNAYLSENILSKLKISQINEGYIYSYLKSFFEEKHGNISIDRDAVTHEYVFVDNNSFDNLLSYNLIDKANDTKNNDIVEKFNNKEVGINQVYNMLALSQLGLSSQIKIIANENVKTQYVRNKLHPNGVIFINTKNSNNNDFINKLNHEFRHLLQDHFGFEGGFTPNFKVTSDMLNDLKKNVPDIFTDKELINMAKYNNAKNVDEFIARHFVYFMVGGEQNAYNIKSNYLQTKPVYVEEKGGKPTIFMPWYDPQTKSGMYNTELIANMKEGIEIPRVDRKPKYKEKTKESKYIYTRRRSFTKKEAEGTNLKYFVKKGVPGDMDPDLKNFIIETTNNETKLPKELMFSIRKGALTKQGLYKWFREVDTMNDYTFNLVNKHMFKNDKITNMKDLDKITNIDVSFIWASMIVLKRHGLSFETLIQENSIDNLVKFIELAENTSYKNEIKKVQEKFDWYYKPGESGFIKFKKGLDKATSDHMRVFTMQYYDGTLAGAFYVARTLRKIVRLYQDTKATSSLDQTIGDSDTTLSDVTSEDGLTSENKEMSNDIIALYEKEFNKATDEKVAEIAAWVKAKNIKDGMSDKDATAKALTIGRALLESSVEVVDLRYEQLQNAYLTGKATRVNIGADIKKDTPLRVNIVARIKRAASAITKHVPPADWKNLPQEVRDMFNGEGAKATLKPEVYSVGKSRVKQDTFKILENANLLKDISSAARANVFVKKDASKKVKQLQEKLDKVTRKMIRSEVSKTKKISSEIRETEFTISKKKRTSDTPNNFTIVSSIDMPPILRKIFDVSFETMANTEVQFVSKDEDGKLFEKNSKEFESNQKHEVTNWDLFFEANRTTLLELTRTEILDIVEFIQKGVNTLDGPANKLGAFQIFMLGYIVDGMRRNFNNWNFSQQEVEMVEKLYEAKASEAGSTLRAVGQMIHVIDPLKKIRQRMLDDYDISDEELEPVIKAVDSLQEEKTFEGRKDKTVEVAQELRKLEGLMINRKVKQTKWAKIKSYRFLSMLSSPITWVRNVISNTILTVFNKASDVLGKMLFINKKYRKEQWNLTDAQISNDVKSFIDNNIKNSDLFNMLYDNTTKYDERTKNTLEQKELFVTMIVNSLERKFAIENKFDNKTFNFFAKFINQMISDKAFIKLAATKYLGKILTIEKVDLTKGFTTEILNYFAEAVIIANQDYIHKRSFLANALDGIKTRNPVAYEVLSFWQPFMNSSFNWYTELIKYSPLGLITAIRDSHRLEQRISDIEKKRAKGNLTISNRAVEYLTRRDIGKATLGTLLLFTGLILGLTGIIKIEDDDDAYYLKVGNLKVDISSIFGTSSLLVGVSLSQIGSTSFEDIMGNVSENLLEGFLLKDILDRHKWDKGAWENLLTEGENALRSFIPQFVQLFVRATNNEKIRYTSGFNGVWERWLNTFIPTQPFGNRKVNPYTGEVETKYAIPFIGEFLKSGIIGPKIFWSEMSDIEVSARELGVNKNELTGELTVNTTKYQLNREKLNQKYGELNKNALATIQSQKHNVQMPDGTYNILSWSEMTDTQRSNVISRTMLQNAEIAKIYVWTTDLNKKYYASQSMLLTLKKLGITKNIYLGGKGFE